MYLKKISFRDSLEGPGVRTQRSHCRGARVQSLVGELRCCMPQDVAKNKKNKKKISFYVMWISPKKKSCIGWRKSRRSCLPICRSLRSIRAAGRWSLSGCLPGAAGFAGRWTEGEDCPPSSLFMYHSPLQAPVPTIVPKPPYRLQCRPSCRSQPRTPGKSFITSDCDECL